MSLRMSTDCTSQQVKPYFSLSFHLFIILSLQSLFTSASLSLFSLPYFFDSSFNVIFIPHAGSKTVTELHGSVLNVFCYQCGHTVERDAFQNALQVLSLPYLFLSYSLLLTSLSSLSFSLVLFPTLFSLFLSCTYSRGSLFSSDSFLFSLSL